MGDAEYLVGPQDLDAAEEAVEISSPGAGVISFQIEGTFTATITFQGIVREGDSETWENMPATRLSTGTSATTTTTTGIYRLAAAGLKRARARVSAYTSGTASVTALAVTAPAPASLAGAAGTGSVVDTELPAAALLADATALPTTPIVGTVAHVYNGTNLNLVRTPGQVAGTSGSALSAVGAMMFDTTAGFWRLPLTARNIADASTASDLAVTALMVHNGTTWDRYRGNSTAAYAQGAIAAGAAVAGANPIVMGGGNSSNNVVAVRCFGSVADNLAASVEGLFVNAEQLVFNGTGFDKLRHANVFKTVALGSGTTETTIWTPAASKKFRLMGFVLTLGAASTMTFKDNTAGTTIFIARGNTNDPVYFDAASSNGILSAAANNVLTVTRGTAATLDGVVWGTEE